MQHGLAELKTPAPGRETQQLARAQLGHATQEFEGLIASLRKIADASRCAYKDATLALFDAASPAAHPSHPAELHAGEQVINVAPVPTAAAPGMARTAE
jgi:hypothetical protein